MTFARSLVVLTWLSLAACQSHPERADRTASTSGSDVDHDGRDAVHPAPEAASATMGAVDAIANARCERETACGNVGDGRTYTSHDDCSARVHADWADALTPYDCPGGVDHAELDECLAQIRAEECASPLSMLERWMECRSSDICEAT